DESSTETTNEVTSPQMDAGTRNGTPDEVAERMDNSYDGPNQSASVTRAAPTSRAQQQAGDTGSAAGAARASGSASPSRDQLLAIGAYPPPIDGEGPKLGRRPSKGPSIWDAAVNSFWTSWNVTPIGMAWNSAKGTAQDTMKVWNNTANTDMGTLG